MDLEQHAPQAQAGVHTVELAALISGKGKTTKTHLLKVLGICCKLSLLQTTTTCLLSGCARYLS